MAKIRVILNYDTEDGALSRPDGNDPIIYWKGLGDCEAGPPLPDGVVTTDQEIGSDGRLPPGSEWEELQPESEHSSPRDLNEAIPLVAMAQNTVDGIIRLRDAGFSATEILAFGKEGMV